MKNYKEMLKKPSRESQPWALWNWNCSISPELVTAQLDWFIECGFGGIAIRPSRDMVPVYLSEEFFELFSMVLRTAGKHGIAIRIADDFSLPWSGCFTAEITHSPRMRAQELRLIENRTLAPLEEVNFTVTSPEKDIYISLKVENGQIDPTSVQELTGSGASCSIKWRVPEGDWKLLVFKKEFIADPASGYIPEIPNHGFVYNPSLFACCSIPFPSRALCFLSSAVCLSQARDCHTAC